MKKSILCGVLLSAALFGIAGGASAQESTFQQSCSRIGVAGSTVSADCRRINGAYTRTSIRLAGIENINGQLRHTGAPTSYQQTCTDIGIEGDVLFATCRRIDGGYQQSSLRLLRIENIDGQLQYR